MAVLAKYKWELNSVFLDMIEHENDWLAISRTIMSKFCSSLSISDLNNIFVCRIQGHQESVSEYLNDLEDCYKVLYGTLNESFCIDIVMKGLNPNFRFELLKYSVPSSLRELKDDLLNDKVIQKAKIKYKAFPNQYLS